MIAEAKGSSQYAAEQTRSSSFLYASATHLQPKYAYQTGRRLLLPALGLKAEPSWRRNRASAHHAFRLLSHWKSRMKSERGRDALPTDHDLLPIRSKRSFADEPRLVPVTKPRLASRHVCGRAEPAFKYPWKQFLGPHDLKLARRPARLHSVRSSWRSAARWSVPERQ